MNLYKLHSNKEELIGYKERLHVPSIAWRKLEYAYEDGDDFTKYRKYIIKSPEFAYRYAHYYMDQERWPEAEPYIIKDPKWATNYAYNVIGERWPEAEPLIMKDPDSAVRYAYNFRNDFEGKGRWREAEPYIATDMGATQDYISYNLEEERFIEAEDNIMKDPKMANWYSNIILGTPWPEAEQYIKQDPDIWNEYKSNWD